MNSRERVLRAIKVKDGLPDRVPIQFDLCRQHVEYFSRKYAMDVDITKSIFEDVTWRISANALRVKMGSDLVIVGASPASDWEKKVEKDGTWLDEYGLRMRQGAIYVDIIDVPLKDAETVEDIENYHFPDPYAPGRYDRAEADIAKFKDEYCVVGDIEGTIFALARNLVGMEKFLCDLYLEEEYIDRLLEKCTEYQTAVGIELIRRGVDILWTGDDFGSQTSLLISAELFREKLKPHYRKMLQAFKAENPDIIMAFHCDGAVSELLDDFVEVGYQLFNPVQPNVPKHSPRELKDGFGEKLAFWGAIDQQALLPKGDFQKIEEEVKEIIRILGENRGFIVAPAHIVQADVSPDCLEHFIAVCKKHGNIYDHQ